MNSDDDQIFDLTEEVKSRIKYLLSEKHPRDCSSFEKKFLSFLSGKGPNPATSEGIKWVKYARSLSIYQDRFPYNSYTGFDKCGLDRKGFNKNGIHFETLTIHDNNGFDKNGFDKDGFDHDGFDKDGYDKNGFNRLNGYNKEGYDKYGFNQKGKDKDGYNRSGFKDGYNRSGYDKYGFDRNGFDVSGKKGMTLEERRREGILEYFNNKAEESDKEDPQPYGGIYSTTDGQ